MRKLIFFAFISLFFFCFSSLNGQTIHTELEKLEYYASNNPQEKLYLQLDKPSYAAGETIWFKAYSTIGIMNLLSNHSRIAYVELIDAFERKIDSLIIPLVTGVGIGDISLSDTIAEGSYRLRAYTKYMLNDSNDYLYDRTIQIFNGRSDNVLTTTVYNTELKNNTVTISLKTLKKDVLANVKVNCEMISKGKVVGNKRYSTDENGDLIVKIPEKYEDVQLNLSFYNQDRFLANKKIKILQANSSNHVTLLPEGGKLLEGFVNTIGIKSIDVNGLAKKAKLFFLTSNDTLGVVNTNDLGMEVFSFIPQTKDSIRVYADYGDAVLHPVDMPKIYTSGYSIQVNNQNNQKLYAKISASDNYVNGEDLYFIVHHLGKTFFVSKQRLNKNEITFSINRGELPTGVITISVLNHTFQPVVERAFFNYNKVDLLALDIKTNKKSYGNREKVEVELSILGDDSQEIAALSATVLNKSKLNENIDLIPNILSSLLLSSDLKGYIQNPGYYFAGDVLHAIDLDYLMLTQGWRNIDWKTLGTESKGKYEVEKSMSISGYTKKLGRSKPESGAKVQLISTGNFLDFVDTLSNEDGYFNFDKLLFTDSIKFLITAKDAKGKNNIDIIYDKPIWAPVSTNKNLADEKSDVNSLYENQLKYTNDYFRQLEQGGLKEKAIAIEEVTVKARKETKASKNSSNLNGPGNADQIITAEELSTCPTLELCLSGRLTGVYWQGGVPYNTRGNTPMQVVMDGMFIEPEQISSINVLDVESIEVLRSINYTAIYGSNGGGGLILITSKTGESAMRSYIPKGIITIQPKGLHSSKEFYAPKYEVSDQFKQIQDLRTTIHWEPSIVLGKEDKTSFSFYTTDEKGRYVIIIEGVSINGKLCRKVLEFDVH